MNLWNNFLKVHFTADAEFELAISLVFLKLSTTQSNLLVMSLIC